MKYIYATGTNQGRIRDTNQDTVYPETGGIADESLLIAVADGMGGHSGGEVASRDAMDAAVGLAGDNPGVEERILAAACLHSDCPHIALMSPAPPGAGWRRLAKRFKKKWVHIPLGQFGASTLQQLRMVHVLNGKHVRSYAAEFIRKA